MLLLLQLVLQLVLLLPLVWQEQPVDRQIRDHRKQPVRRPEHRRFGACVELRLVLSAGVPRPWRRTCDRALLCDAGMAGGISFSEQILT